MDDGGQTEEESCLMGVVGYTGDERMERGGRTSWTERQGFPRVLRSQNAAEKQ